MAKRVFSLAENPGCFALVMKLKIHAAQVEVCLGDVGVWCGGDTTPSEAAMSLVGTSRTGSTWSAQGMGRSRGVVVVEEVPSMRSDFTAKGQGVSEFTCPLAAERGGTEMQELSLSLGVITG